jgi:acetylornithine/N-succinyldiaminopimelate aminotransferase
MSTPRPAPTPPPEPAATIGAHATHARPSGEGATHHLVALGERHLLQNYRQAPFVLQRGSGCELFDVEGKRWLDLCSGVAVCSVGHAHPTLVRAIAEQAGRLMHTSNYFYNEENVLLAAELTARTGYDRAFFCNSGAEAVETALKAARRTHYVTGDTKRTRVVAFDHSFHGRTMGALALTGNPKYQEGFAPGVTDVVHLPFGDVGAIEAAMGPEVAAVFVEPVQGEGGVFPAPEGYLRALRELCDHHGALLVVDEVQTGIGRTGRFLGAEHDGVRGDIVTLAKGLGGGFPVGAVLFSERAAAALTPGTHGSTFGGNALASHAARTVLRILDEEGLVERAAERGQRLAAGLRGLVSRFPTLLVSERGRGLLRGLVLARGVEPRKVLEAARAEGALLTVAGSDAVRFTPPLVISEAELDEGLGMLERALGRLAEV